MLQVHLHVSGCEGVVGLGVAAGALVDEGDEGLPASLPVYGPGHVGADDVEGPLSDAFRPEGLPEGVPGLGGDGGEDLVDVPCEAADVGGVFEHRVVGGGVVGWVYVGEVVGGVCGHPLVLEPPEYVVGKLPGGCVGGCPGAGVLVAVEAEVVELVGDYVEYEVLAGLQELGVAEVDDDPAGGAEGSGDDEGD